MLKEEGVLAVPDFAHREISFIGYTYQSSVQGDLQSRQLRIESNNKKGSA